MDHHCMKGLSLVRGVHMEYPKNPSEPHVIVTLSAWKLSCSRWDKDERGMKPPTPVKPLEKYDMRTR